MACYMHSTSVSHTPKATRAVVRITALAILLTLFGLVVACPAMAADTTPASDATPTVQPTSSTSDGYLDQYNNLTSYAICERSGSDLVNKLEECGYTYNDAKKGYLSSDGRSFFGVVDKSLNPLGKSDIKTRERGGGYPPVAFVRQTFSYRSAREMLNGMTGYGDIKEIDEHSFPEGRIVAIMEDYSSMQKHLVTVEPIGQSGAYNMILYPEEVANYGLYKQISEKMGSEFQKYGAQIDEIWANARESSTTATAGQESQGI